MKFAMGGDVLSQLTKKTSTSSDDLGALVKQLAQAGEPLEGKFNGAGRAAFDQFNAQSEQIANELNAALAAVLGGISGMDRAFKEGDQEMFEQTRSTESSVSYDAARFSTTR
ncbi:uncharacterized protein YukE [Microbacterium natoriense]|uniref:Uncharacterized protein YukE n=1 Tax=Microbacterium natoriense TaxID=284570 RepID=A0AAW8F2E2_9MICO|nr:hypothetical protein [Microbacterium natoriense]MDQ0648631.1 uncharacterized protein YukE [Microbacterium natoriense]